MVADSANAETVRAYEDRADLYREQTAVSSAGWLADFRDVIVAATPRAAGGPAPRVLELGSGTGDGARDLTARGLTVQPSDATRAFLEMMRADGLDPIELNALTDDLGGPWDAVVAFAVFLHFSPYELAGVLARARHGIRDGGVLAFTVKEGDGAGWSDHKLGVARHVTYWRPEPLRQAVEAQGWQVASIERRQGRLDDWILVLARGEPPR